MPESLKRISKQLNEFWNNLDKSNRIRIGLIAAVLLVIVVCSTILLNKKEYSVLYTDLEPQDAGEIMTALNDMKVEAKTQGSSTILVDKKEEDKVRMMLASEGYPKNGFNYDFFTNNISFSTTDFEKQKYLQFQLQDRLQDTIRTLDGVYDAIVTISLPEQDSFVLKSDRQPSSASVVLILESGVEIISNKIKAIEDLMTKSVIGLTPENLSIVDNNMNILNDSEKSEIDIANNQYQVQNDARERFKKQITSMLEPIFGRGNVITEVSVELNFDEQITESIQFEPVIDDEGIIVSMNELIEQMNDSIEGGVPGQDSNMGVSVYPELRDTEGAYNRTHRTINYEVNQIKEQIKRAQGQIKEMSVSVVINNGGNEISQEVMGGVQDVVAGAVGINTDRVVVRNMTFAEGDLLKDRITIAMEQRELDARNKFIRSMILYGLGALIIFAMLFFAYKALVLKRKKILVETPEGFEIEMEEDGLTMKEKPEERRNIEKFIREKPEEAAQLLRTWLTEE
jgi:flagellar M-ring protein FliF